MNAPDRFFLADVQASADQRQLAIHKVGVKGLRYPLALLDADGAALVIHANRDDQTTQPTGGSGDRIACGVIAP